MIPAKAIRKGMTISALVSALSGCMARTVQPCDPHKLFQEPPEMSITAEYKEGVSFIKDVRKFGIGHLGLYECSQHYTWFDNNSKSEHTLYILTVTKPTVLPKSRNEKHEFLNYFSFYRADVSDFLYLHSYKDELTDEHDYYREKGYDVYWRSTTNYNDSGGKGSPITPLFLARSKVSQAQAIFHEACHATVEHNISGSFSAELNESYCNLMEHAGAVEYFHQKHLQKKGSLEDYAEAVHSFHQQQDFANKVISVYSQLQFLYQSNKSLQQKMEERKNIFEEAKQFIGEEVNNATLWDRYPYAAYFPLFYQWYEKEGSNVKAVIEKMKSCPAEEKEALEYIQKLAK